MEQNTPKLMAWLSVPLLFVLPLLAFVLAGLWLLWLLTDGVLGRQLANLAVLALLAASFTLSQLTGRRGGFGLKAAGRGVAVPVWLVLGLLGYVMATGG